MSFIRKLMQKPKFQEAIAAAQANQAGTATGPKEYVGPFSALASGRGKVKSGGFLGRLRKKLPADMTSKKSTLG